VDAVYLPLRVEAGEDSFRAFMAAARQSWLNLTGLSVTLPHKENALRYLGRENVDELSWRIGAINTIAVRPDGPLRGTNTDYAGAIDALACAMGIAREGLCGLRCGVIGAGGVARAVVAALRHYGADVVIHNRTAKRAQTLADEFACRAAPLDTLGNEPLEVLVNCTSVGMHPDVNSTPLPQESLARLTKAVGGLVVFDTIYAPVQTRLLSEARKLSCRCVSGLEMFVNQAMGQFTFWTGLQPSASTFRRACSA
jgi:3-dehydroquinate dehydratase / shikimate dehydrogenase